MSQVYDQVSLKMKYSISNIQNTGGFKVGIDFHPYNNYIKVFVTVRTGIAYCSHQLTSPPPLLSSQLLMLPA